MEFAQRIYRHFCSPAPLALEQAPISQGVVDRNIRVEELAALLFNTRFDWRAVEDPHEIAHLRQAVALAPSLQDILNLDETLFPEEVLQPVYNWLAETMCDAQNICTREGLVQAYLTKLVQEPDLLKQVQKNFTPALRTRLWHLGTVAWKAVDWTRCKAQYLFAKTFCVVAESVAVAVVEGVLGLGALLELCFHFSIWLGVVFLYSEAFCAYGLLILIVDLLLYKLFEKLEPRVRALGRFLELVKAEIKQTFRFLENLVISLGPLQFGMPVFQQQAREHSKWLKENFFYAHYKESHAVQELTRRFKVPAAKYSAKQHALLDEAHCKLWQSRLAAVQLLGQHWFAHYCCSFQGEEAGKALQQMLVQQPEMREKAFRLIQTCDRVALMQIQSLPELKTLAREFFAQLDFCKSLYSGTEIRNLRVLAPASVELTPQDRFVCWALERLDDQVRDAQLDPRGELGQGLRQLSPLFLAQVTVNPRYRSVLVVSNLKYFTPTQLNWVIPYLSSPELFAHFDLLQERMGEEQLIYCLTIEQRESLQQRAMQVVQQLPTPEQFAVLEKQLTALQERMQALQAKLAAWDLRNIKAISNFEEVEKERAAVIQALMQVRTNSLLRSKREALDLARFIFLKRVGIIDLRIKQMMQLRVALQKAEVEITDRFNAVKALREPTVEEQRDWFTELTVLLTPPPPPLGQRRVTALKRLESIRRGWADIANPPPGGLGINSRADLERAKAGSPLRDDIWILTELQKLPPAPAR